MTGVWIALLLMIIAGIQAGIWIPLLLWFRRRTRKWKASLQSEIASSGETLVLGPERGLYGGASFGYPQVRGNGVMVLTDKRLLFRKLTGGIIEIALSDVAGMREDKVFLSSVRAGRIYLILQLKDRAEVGFIVHDHPAWMAALRERLT
jgi:hypothetical protein